MSSLTHKKHNWTTKTPYAPLLGEDRRATGKKTKKRRCRGEKRQQDKVNIFQGSTTHGSPEYFLVLIEESVGMSATNGRCQHWNQLCLPANNAVRPTQICSLEETPQAYMSCRVQTALHRSLSWRDFVFCPPEAEVCGAVRWWPPQEFLGCRPKCALKPSKEFAATRNSKREFADFHKFSVKWSFHSNWTFCNKVFGSGETNT